MIALTQPGIKRIQKNVFLTPSADEQYIAVEDIESFNFKLF